MRNFLGFNWSIYIRFLFVFSVDKTVFSQPFRAKKVINREVYMGTKAPVKWTIDVPESTPGNPFMPRQFPVPQPQKEPAPAPRQEPARRK